MASIHSRAKPSALGQATHASRSVGHKLLKKLTNTYLLITFVRIIQLIWNQN